MAPTARAEWAHGGSSRPVGVPSFSSPLAVVPDFAMAAIPSSLSFSTVSAGVSKMVVSSVNGFSGNVSLQAFSNPIDSLLFLNRVLVYVPAGGTANANLTVTSGVDGSFYVSVVGTAGELTHYVTLSVTVVLPPTADFILSGSPRFLTIELGTNNTFQVFFEPRNGFTGTVSVSVSVTPQLANSPLATLNRTLVNVPLHGWNFTFLRVSTFPSTLPRDYNLTVTGEANGISHTIILGVMIVPFTLAVDSLSQNIVTKNSRNSTVSLASTGGFEGTVDLDVTISDPGLTAGIDPGNVTLTTKKGENAILTISPSASTQTGGYAVGVKATTGLAFRSITISVLVSDFTISAEPVSVAMFPGGSGNSTVSLGSVGAFFNLVVDLNATLDLSSAGTPAVSLSPSSIFFGSGATRTSLVTISASSETRPGNYTVVVTGTYGGLSHSAIIVAVVRTPIPVIKPPTAGLVYAPQNPRALQEVSFSGSSSYDPDGEIVSWAWSFGDPPCSSVPCPASSGETVTHVYRGSGDYTVTLTVTDDQEATSKTSLLVHVLPALSLVVRLDMGSTYQEGSTVVMSIHVAREDESMVRDNAQVEIVLTRPDGSSVGLGTTRASGSSFKAEFLVPSADSAGTYVVTVTARENGFVDGSDVRSFAVTPTSISQPPLTMALATVLAGVLVASGALMALVLRKRFRRSARQPRDEGLRQSDEPQAR